MRTETVNSEEFLSLVRPAIADCCPDDLACIVNDRWTSSQLCSLLRDRSVDVRKAACVVLGLVGDERAMFCLSGALQDESAEVCELAEHALWSIWFRSGSAEAQGDFRRGLKAMEDDKPAEAVEHFRRAHEADPNFAEAYNQCAIAHYMLEEYDEAMEDCHKAVELVPFHFGALTGLGHCHACAGNLHEAARAYRRALRVHPRMETIAAALQRIEQCLHSRTQ
jgi:tetratricopeptide (TPR) repeat protein